MDDESLKAILAKMEEGSSPMMRPEIAKGLGQLSEMQKDSVELNYDSKTGEVKAIHVKAYDLTSQGAAKAAVAGLLAVKAALKEASL